MTILTRTFRYLLILLSIFIPITKGRYVFSSYSVKIPKDLFWFIENLTAHDNSEFIWLGCMSQDSKKIKRFEKNKFWAYFYSLTAEKVFFTHSLNDLNGVYNIKSQRINLWHGCPIKRMGEDSLMFSSNRGYLKRYFRPEKILWDTFFAGAEVWEPIFRNAFGFKRKQLDLGGLPRSAYLRSFDTNKGNFMSKKIITFMPTYRIGITNYMAYDLILKSEALQCFLSENDMQLLVKLHPMDKYLFHESEVILNAKDDDVFDLMLKSKAVITDYSSLIFDYSILRKPLILFMPDLDEFSNTIGGFYFDFPYSSDFEWIEKCYCEADLVNALGSIISDNSKLPSDEFINKYNSFNATEYFLKEKING